MSNYGTEDAVFQRIVQAGLSVKSDGDLDSGSGHFSLVVIPEHGAERAQMRETVFGNDEEADDHATPADLFNGLDAGWYFVVMRTGGSVFVYECDSEESALQEFRETQETEEMFEPRGR